ncbi:MAG TPA: hypothetical protein VEV41_01180 [Terriglobales bacterium]|nr:hypothetical protein [Terriglobales bacterium]
MRVGEEKWELAILATVHGFYLKLLQDYFAGELPIPAGLDTDALSGSDRAQHTLETMQRWLKLLDMAVSPAMVRYALTNETDPEIAEGLLRYYARKKKASDQDRDKTDLVATFLYRNPRVPGQWERRGYALDGILPIPPFEIALTEILADGEVVPLSGEEMQRLAELDILRAKAEIFRDFGLLLESGLVDKIREIKRALGSSFYHPAVLGYVAPFNVGFGKKFDTLFRAASFEIKKFSQSVEQRGGSIVGQVDGVDVTVELVAAMDEDEILKSDYSTALERFRRVTKLKKSMEGQPKMKLAAAAGVSSVTEPFGRLADVASKSARPSVPSKPAVPPTSDPRLITLEETKLRSVEGSIRAFVRAANPKLREIVPMTSFNLILTAAEADAFCAEFLEEDSFRADHARILVRVVAIVARMSSEIEELKRRRFTYLAKPHADSLMLLLAAAKTAKENADLVLELAGKRGLKEKVITLEACLQKLRERSELAEKALGELTGTTNN